MRVLIRRLRQPRFTLYPLSDVHWPAHDKGKLDAWREAVLADDDALVTLGGDLFDFARGKYRSHLESYTADGNSRDPVDDLAYGWVEDFAAYLKPIAKRICGAVVGNHFWRFKNGRVSDQELVLQLGAGDTFCGSLGMIRLDLPWHKVGRRTTSVSIALHHDAGRKGGTEGADLLAFVHWSRAVRANVYCAGHTHEQWVRPARLELALHADSAKLGDEKRIFIRSGAFLKGYGGNQSDAEQPFEADYAEVKMLPPALFGIVSCSVRLNGQMRPLYKLQQDIL